MKLENIINYKKWSQIDFKLIENQKLDQFILQKILRKPFRKQKISQKGKDDIFYAIQEKIKKGEPLNFLLLFGGYKHFWNKSSPYVDWAELFFIDHFIEWVTPILEIYKPGIVLTFASEDIIVDEMNGYNKTDLDNYSKSFKILLSKMEGYFPNNLKFEYIRMGQDVYDGKKVKKEVLKDIDKKIIDFKKKDVEWKKEYLYRSKKNLKSENATLDDEIRSKVIEDYFYEVEEKYAGKFFSEDKIYITLTWGRSKEENILEWLSIGSTRSTLVDFWIGKGLIEKRDEKCIKKIFSQNQYKKIENQIENIQIKSFISELNNFDQIEIYKKLLKIEN